MFYAYILRCADDTLYAGSTPDLAKRLHEHNHAKSGAKYTRARRPVVVAHVEEFETLKEARAREVEYKRLSRAEKLELIGNGQAEEYSAPHDTGLPVSN